MYKLYIVKLYVYIDKHISSRTRVRPLFGPLINCIKWVLKYYLEVILYNCV